MFEDSLLESGKRFKTRRPVTTTLSFAVQTVLVGVVVVVSLLVPQALPIQHHTTLLLAPSPPPPAAHRAAPVQVKVHKAATQVESGRLHTPTEIPKKIAIVKDEAPPPTTAGVVGGVTGGVPGGVPGGVLGGVLTSVPNVPAPAPKVDPPQKLRVSSGVVEGNKISGEKPPYPPLALQARIQGTVKLQAVIGKDGSVQNLKVVSGQRLLAQAALDAVKHWRYKPFYLNGEPYEVEAEISIVFTLSGG